MAVSVVAMRASEAQARRARHLGQGIADPAVLDCDSRSSGYEYSHSIREPRRRVMRPNRTGAASMRIRKLAPVEWLHPGSCVIRSPSRVACLASVVLALCCMPAIAGCNLQVIAELPVTLLGLHPLITVQINRSGIPVVLDSGAMFNLLSYDTTAKLRLIQPNIAVLAYKADDGKQAVDSVIRKVWHAAIRRRFHLNSVESRTFDGYQVVARILKWRRGLHVELQETQLHK
jgi:hypothetical protein